MSNLEASWTCQRRVRRTAGQLVRKNLQDHRIIFLIATKAGRDFDVEETHLRATHAGRLLDTGLVHFEFKLHERASGDVIRRRGHARVGLDRLPERPHGGYEEVREGKGDRLAEPQDPPP